MSTQTIKIVEINDRKNGLDNVCIFNILIFTLAFFEYSLPIFMRILKQARSLVRDRDKQSENAKRDRRSLQSNS